MIHPNLMMALARYRVEDLRRSSRHRLPDPAILQPHRTEATESTLTLRPAVAIQDDEVIRRLAALADSTVPAAPTLIAFVGGEARAALSLTDGTSIADPFHPTAYLVDLLRARARQLERPSRARRLRRPRSFSVLGAQFGGHR